MPAMALSRAAARVVESGPDGGNLAPGVRQRLEALPDPRSPQGRIYPLACLIAIALCAVTAAGNHRFTAVGQWIKRAGQADLARLHALVGPRSSVGIGRLMRRGAALAGGAGQQRHPRHRARHTETRALRTAHVSGLPFPHGRQAIKITRWRKYTGTGTISYAVTSLTSADATAAGLACLVREHWSIEAHHHNRSPGVPDCRMTLRGSALRRAFATHLVVAVLVVVAAQKPG